LRLGHTVGAHQEFDLQFFHAQYLGNSCPKRATVL
jgi:hypothetical protein